MEEIKYECDIGKFGDTLNRVILRSYPHRTKDFVNSFISNQVRCKVWLVTELKKLLKRKQSDIKPTRVTVLGCWYGNLITELLLDNIENLKQIDLMDMDEDALVIGRKFLHNTISNTDVKINFICEDINFFEFDDFYTHIVINTSCEHMFPMSSINFRNDKDVIYCLQSNDLHDVREHVNCVNTVEELVEQAAIKKCYYRGTREYKASHNLNRDKYKRFMVIGKR